MKVASKLVCLGSRPDRSSHGCGIIAAVFLTGVFLCAPSSANAQTVTIFSDNFNSYAPGSSLAGQGGWYQDPSHTAPLILSTTTPLGTVAIDGTIRTGTGQYNGTSYGTVRHALPPLNPNAITVVSTNAYAYSAYMSHDAGLGIENADFSVELQALADWYPSGSPTWAFYAAANPPFSQDYFNGAYDQPVLLQIVIDGGAGQSYFRLTYSSGTYESPHRAITPAQISELTEVSVFEDYRDVYLGIAMGDVTVTSTLPDTTPPVISNLAVSPYPVALNTTSILTATVDDSTTGGSNIASAYYSVSGGTSSQMLLAPSTAVTTQASASLAPFSQSNVYNVCVHGTDTAGNTSADACVLLPVYDPNGGFVTGGGQVGSPAGADLINPSAAGPATFGFVSKYLKGSNTPSGNLEFHFKDGNLDFKSTSMDWLVVTGEPRAKFHGIGIVNGANVCNFEVDAWAGSFTGNVDAFGLKITSCSNGGDRYSLPATALTKGNIIIHK